jgi:guanylate kinase
MLVEIPNLWFSVSYTTRSPRGQEKQGKDYHFISREKFTQMIENKEFLEWENVYGDYCYGTAEAPVREAFARGQDVLLDIDVKGAGKVKARRPDAILLFVMPPSYDELQKRLRGRGVDGEETILNRLKIARQEIKGYTMYDYLIVNQDIEDSLTRLKAIVTAARCRVSRMEKMGAQILRTFGE